MGLRRLGPYFSPTKPKRPHRKGMTAQPGPFCNRRRTDFYSLVGHRPGGDLYTQTYSIQVKEERWDLSELFCHSLVNGPFVAYWAHLSVTVLRRIMRSALHNS
uniref:Uncharacterized protein n=1 Tax=Oryza rufipogon TaxID=4529 RepID=A0A0E0N6Y4_ORYRU